MSLAHRSDPLCHHGRHARPADHPVGRAALGHDRSAPRPVCDHNSCLSHECTIGPDPTGTPPVEPTLFAPVSTLAQYGSRCHERLDCGSGRSTWPGACHHIIDRDPSDSGCARQGIMVAGIRPGVMGRRRRVRRCEGSAALGLVGCRAAVSYICSRTGLRLHHCVRIVNVGTYWSRSSQCRRLAASGYVTGLGPSTERARDCQCLPDTPIADRDSVEEWLRLSLASHRVLLSQFNAHRRLGPGLPVKRSASVRQHRRSATPR